MDIVPQILVLALISSAVYALLATGLTLTFGTLEFVNLAHGDMAMVGAYIFFTAYSVQHLPLFIALVITTLAMALLGYLIERFTFRPVRNRQEFIPLLLSLGVGIVATSAITIFFGAGSKTYFSPGESSAVFHLANGAVTITLIQIIIILTAASLIGALYFFLHKTRTGKAIRAVADNKEVAAIMGISVNRSMSILFLIATALAGVAGVLVAFDQNFHPYMGTPLSVKIFAAIILGGVGKLHGAIVGAIIIALAENLVIGLTPIQSSYKELVIFVILIGILIIKPYGLFGGSKEEMESR